MKKIIGIRVFLLLLIILWMQTIFGFSAETGTQSQSLSDTITVKVVNFAYPDYENMEKETQIMKFDQMSFLVRKTGHFGEYCILGVLLFAFAWTFRKYRNLPRRKQMLLVIISFLYACTDEFHQGFVDGRSPKIMDVCIDTCGAFVGTIGLLYIFLWLSKYKTNRKEKAEKGKQMKPWEQYIRKVTPYTPGEQPKAENVVKLNTNENPYPPAPGVVKALKDLDPSLLRKYPDPEAGVLVEAIAKHYNVNTNQVFVGVGSDDVLGMAFLTFFNSDKPVLFPDITYSFYDVWADLFQIPYESIPLNEQFEIVPELFYKENGGIVFPNPNAPTAMELPLSQIEEIIMHNQDSVVIVDEAYVDFGATSALELIDKYENVLVVQTFSKSRSAAGLRIGFAIGSEKLIQAMLAVKFSYNSYTMNQAVIYAGAASIEDDVYFKEVVAKIVATREQAKVRLRELGFECTDSKANFLFVTHENANAEEIFNYLKTKNIYVRHFKKPRIDNYLRITIGTDEEMEKLYAALKEYLK